MKKRHILYVILSIFFVLILSNFRIVDKETTNAPKTSPKDNTTSILSNKENTPATETEKEYLIKLYNGNLNVYDRNNNVVETITIDFDSMRDYDKKQFTKGITVSNLEEIKHIAEDFSE